MDAKQLLEQLTEAQARLDLLRMDKKNAIPAEVQAVLDEIDAEFTPKIEAAGAVVVELEAKAKEAVIAAGETVEGGAFKAVYVKPRVTWDSKQLDGMMILIPELAQARKEGSPTVQLRRVG